MLSSSSRGQFTQTNKESVQKSHSIPLTIKCHVFISAKSHCIAFTEISSQINEFDQLSMYSRWLNDR